MLDRTVHRFARKSDRSQTGPRLEGVERNLPRQVEKRLRQRLQLLRSFAGRGSRSKEAVKRNRIDECRVCARAPCPALLPHLGLGDSYNSDDARFGACKWYAEPSAEQIRPSSAAIAGSIGFILAILSTFRTVDNPRFVDPQVVTTDADVSTSPLVLATTVSDWARRPSQR